MVPVPSLPQDNTLLLQEVRGEAGHAKSILDESTRMLFTWFGREWGLAKIAFLAVTWSNSTSLYGHNSTPPYMGIIAQLLTILFTSLRFV